MVMEESDMELASENIPVPQVQEPVIDTVKRNNKSGASHGKPRLRKKALHTSILKQMEFYFSDANLSKDRYLSGLLKENLYIDLEVFTRCNKLRELTTDTNRIAKALQGSTMLKVSEDGTKVCRLTPIQKKENIDQCTIYVQNLPPDADHDWLISIFSKYGSVEYVSIPRYKNNRKIKGFAFVEFDMPNSAQECIKTFRKKGRVLPSYVSPNELLSITTFDEAKKDAVVGLINSKAKAKLKNNEKEKASSEEIENNIHEVNTEANNSKQSFKKRKYSLEKSAVTDENDIKIKKKKKEATDRNTIDQQDGKGKIPKAESEDKNNIYDNEINAADNNSRQSSKKRKYSLEKLFVTDENDIKVEKEKKDMNQIIGQNEKETVLKENFEDKDNENDMIDNDKQDIRKEKYVTEESFVTDRNDMKIKKKKKAADQNITYEQNEKEKLLKELEKTKDNSYNNEIDTAYNNDNQYLKKGTYAPEKSLIADQNDIKIKKRRKESVDQTITDQQEEKISRGEPEDKDNVNDNEIEPTNDNNRQSLKKRKVISEKSSIKDEKEVIGNSDTENQENPNKNRNKIEKKKRRLTIDDTIVAKDIIVEAVKKECQKPAVNSNKNKVTELEYLHEDDESNETNVLQTEKYSKRDIGMRNSDIEEISVDERKKKKNRKKRNKVQNNDICSKIGLQVMAKSDWKRLRNRYLDLQRHKMSQLKLHLRKAEVERGGIKMTKNGWYHDKTGQNIMSYDKSKHEIDNGKFDEKKSYGRVNYTPGIIVKIEMDEPCTDLQSFKMELRDNNSVKYIDVAVDSCEAYVRCDIAEAAQTLVQKGYEGRRLTVLEGDEEKLYWNKISEDRMEKFQTKRIKQRGRNKLLKRAEKELGKYIKFDQD